MALALCAGFAPALAAATIQVPQDQPTIQAGIDAAVDGDTVLVADGTWSGDGNRDLDFLGKAITVRSEDGYESCIIDCEGGTANHRGFLLASDEGTDSVIKGFTIRHGSYYGGMSSDKFGGAICLLGAGVTVDSCRLLFNGSRRGGAIFGENATVVLRDSIITSNVAEHSGSGIRLDYCDTVIEGCEFRLNHGTPLMGGYGIALSINGGTAAVTNCVFHDNDLYQNYATLAVVNGSAEIAHCTFSDNAGTWNEKELRAYEGQIVMTHCVISARCNDVVIVSGPSGEFIASWSDIDAGDGTVWPGEGNIGAEPLFVTGPHGDCYLSQKAAGQIEDSPCVNAGDPGAGLIPGSTRSDEVVDQWVLDMGYHYPAVSRPLITTGPGPDPGNPPTVRVFPPIDDAEHEFAFLAYGVPAYGVNVATGDPDGDGVDEILTGAGPGAVFGPHVRGFEVEGAQLPGLSFQAYGTNKYGVNVACGDLDGDGTDEIITGAGPGAVFGPHVRGWSYQGETGVASLPGVNYFAYGTPKWGVNVTAGDIDGDGFDEIVTGAGPGAVYGPHVRGWDVDGGSAAPIPTVSFFAYGTHKYGVKVTAGDVDGDGIDEIITGAGPGVEFGPHVRGWNYDAVTITPLDGYSFFAWDTGPFRCGLNVSAGIDLDGDGRDELVAGRGPDPEANTEVKVFTYDGTAVNQWIMLKAFPGYRFGTTVAAGRFLSLEY